MLPQDYSPCDMRYPACRHWNILSTCRIPWCINRTEGGIVYARGVSFDRPHPVLGSTDLTSIGIEEGYLGISSGVTFVGDYPPQLKEVYVPLDDPHPQLSFPS